MTSGDGAHTVSHVARVYDDLQAACPAKDMKKMDRRMVVSARHGQTIPEWALKAYEALAGRATAG